MTMTQLTYGDPYEIDMTYLNENLRADLAGDLATDWTAYEARAYNGNYLTGQTLQIVWSKSNRRAGIVFCGSKSSGHTSWTDASSPADASRRYQDDNMSN